jgi:hypothetical protein
MGVAGAQAERINAAVNMEMVDLIFIRPLLQNMFAEYLAGWRAISFFLFCFFCSS